MWTAGGSTKTSMISSRKSSSAFSTAGQRANHAERILKDLHEDQKLNDLNSCNLVLTAVKDSMRIPAHKEVFFTCFPSIVNNKVPKPNEFDFEAMSGASLQKIVNFSYEGSIRSFANEVELIEVQSFAKKYVVDDLDEFCTDEINRIITAENCLEFLFKYQEVTQSDPIQSAWFNIVVKNFTKVSQRPEFIEIPATWFEEMLKSKELAAPETDIFLAFLKWYYKKKNFSFDMGCFQTRTDASNVLRLIRFPLISAEIFAKHAEPILIEYNFGELVTEYYKWQTFKDNPSAQPEFIKSNERMEPRENGEQIERLPEEYNRLDYNIIKYQSENELLRTSLVVFGYSDTKSAWVIEMLSDNGIQWNPIQRNDQLIVIKNNIFRKDMRCIMIDSENIVLTGGGNLNYKTDKVYRINLRTLIKYQMPKMLFGRSRHGISVEKEMLYIAGGEGSYGGILRMLEKYDTETNIWTPLADMKEARADVSLIWANGLLYAIGGESEIGALDTVEYYEENMDRWTKTTSMPTARSAIAAVSFGDHIYVLGGISSECDDLKVVERFDLRTDQWTTVAPLNFGRYNISAIVFNEKIHAIGGMQNKISTNLVEIYDEKENAWKEAAKLNYWHYSAVSFIASKNIFEINEINENNDNRTETECSGSFCL